MYNVFFFSVSNSKAHMIENDRLNIFRIAKEINNARNENVLCFSVFLKCVLFDLRQTK